MTPSAQIRIAVVGLEFGSSFLPGFLAHPRVEAVGICDINESTLNRVGDRYGIARRHKALDDLIAGNDYHAIALFTPIPQHARQAIAVLEGGKHCASAVPMATTVDDCRAIVKAQQRSGRNYMMMETSVANDEYFLLAGMHERGEFGRLQFMRGRFYHNLENHPRYWWGLPPMHYITHPLSPILALADSRVSRVCCFGTGEMRQELQEVYDNPYPIETAIFQLESGIAVEITSITYHTAVQPMETFDVYGERRSFKWRMLYEDQHALIELLPVIRGGGKTGPRVVMRLQAPPARDRLPEALRQAGATTPHAHLAHEFIMSIVESRPPRVDAVTAANWTVPGLVAHASAMAGGQQMDVPMFE